MTTAGVYGILKFGQEGVKGTQLQTIFYAQVCPLRSAKIISYLVLSVCFDICVHGHHCQLDIKFAGKAWTSIIKPSCWVDRPW